MAEADTTAVYVGFLGPGTSICTQKPNIYRCICSCRDGLGFYAEIPIIFGTVYNTIQAVCNTRTYILAKTNQQWDFFIMASIREKNILPPKLQVFELLDPINQF